MVLLASKRKNKTRSMVLLASEYKSFKGKKKFMMSNISSPELSIQEKTSQSFTKASDEVLSDRRLSDSEKILFIRLTKLSYKKGYCFASTRWLANDCGVTTRTLYRYLTQLEKLGYILRETDEDSFHNRKRKIFLGAHMRWLNNNKFEDTQESYSYIKTVHNSDQKVHNSGGGCHKKHPKVTQKSHNIVTQKSYIERKRERKKEGTRERSQNCSQPSNVKKREEEKRKLSNKVFAQEMRNRSQTKSNSANIFFEKTSSGIEIHEPNREAPLRLSFKSPFFKEMLMKKLVDRELITNEDVKYACQYM
jgi:DNA-binding transcriptional regulator YhcF (GntR family)